MELRDENAMNDQLFGGFIKNIKEPFALKGMITSLKHYKPNKYGVYVLVDDREFPNTLCNLGNALAAKLFADNTGTRPTHMAVGTTSGGKTSASTTLEAEVGRVALDSTTCPAAGAANDNVVTYVATFPAGTGTGALVEAAILNAAAAGTMICYAEYGVVTKAAADIVIFTWTLTMGTS